MGTKLALKTSEGISQKMFSLTKTYLPITNVIAVVGAVIALMIQFSAMNSQLDVMNDNVGDNNTAIVELATDVEQLSEHIREDFSNVVIRVRTLERSAAGVEVGLQAVRDQLEYMRSE